MKRLIVALIGASVLSTSAVSVASAAGDPPWLPADPSKPIRLNPKVTYPDTGDPPAFSDQAPAGGVVPLAAGTRRYVSVANSAGGAGYARVRTAPGDLVEGNAIRNTAFDQQATYGNPVSWLGGYVYGSIGGCGWLYIGSLGAPSGTGGTGCASPSRPRSDIATYWNGQVNCGVNEDGNYWCDGTSVNLTCSTVYEYANARPWSPGGAVAQDLIRIVSNPSRSWNVRWRYLARAAPGAAYVMARDTHIPTTDGNWVFIEAGCFPSLPGAVPITN